MDFLNNLDIVAASTAIAGTFSGGVAWLYSLQTRIAVQETKGDGLKEQIRLGFDAIENRLDRMERNLDHRYHDSANRSS